MRLEGLLKAGLVTSIFKSFDASNWQMCQPLLNSPHQEHVASMMPRGPKGAAANNLAEHLASVGALRPCHLSVPTCWGTGLGCAGTWAHGGGLSLSLCLSVHLSVRTPDELRTRQRWADTGPAILCYPLWLND